MQSDKPLLHRTAMVSGALGSIGKAIARELARRGAAVSLGDLQDNAAADEFLSEECFAGATHRYNKVDVSDEQQVIEWVADTERTLGTPDIIIPCAAIVTRMSVRHVDSASWSRELHINLDGSFHLAQQGALAMLRKGIGGNIVFIGSWVAARPVPRIATYCVGKAALRMLMKCMALDFAPNGILVNEVAPGYVDAGLTGETLRANPERRTALEEQTPTGRLIEADEVAYHVVNLCDPRSHGVNGTTLLLDGGVSLRTA